MYELTISLKSKSRIPLYEQIYQYIKGDIQNGRIPYGERLPSTRALSKHLEVSRSTVELSYEQLLSEGYIEAKPCKGFFVSQIEELYHLQKVPPQLPKKKAEKRKYQYDFSANGIDLNNFPYNVWRKLSRDILLDNNAALFCAGDSQGEYNFRNAICSYLYQARGVNCTPEQIVIGAGNDYLLMLLGTIIGPSCKIGVEDPAYMQAYRLFKRLSYNTVPISMDKNGMCVTELRESQADIAYVTPSHQYPTGIIMPIKRRMELLKWAAEKDERLIVEDDYDSEFRYKGKPIPALQGYDVNDKVVYLGTFSKSIAPAIRLSYMVLPKPLLNVYEEKSHFINVTVSKMDQLLVQRFIEQGYYERHLNKTRALYKSRHDILIEELKPLLHMCSISGEHAGVHLLLTFPPERSEKQLIDLAAEKDVRVYGLSEYCIQKRSDQHTTILLGYANLSEEQIKKAVKQLVECWS